VLAPLGLAAAIFWKELASDDYQPQLIEFAMNWAEEFWLKLYRRASPSFMSMHWQARALFRLVLTELDPSSGKLELGRLGLKAVAVAVQAPWPEVEPYLMECLDDECLAVDGGFLVCPNYLEAQQAIQTGAARMRKLREARKVARDAASPNRDESSRQRDESSRQRDAVTHTVTRGDASDDKRREEKRREEQIPDPPVVPQGGRKRSATVKRRLPPEWSPSPAHYSQALTESGKDRAWVDREAQAMRDWAASKGERCCDWDARFRNWIRRAPDLTRLVNGQLDLRNQPRGTTPIIPLKVYGNG